MKKILFALISIGVLFSSHAQEAAGKKLQAGIILGSGLNFITPGTKLISKNGVGTDLTIGMNFNYNFKISSTVGINSGIEFDFESFKYKAEGESPLYYYYNDSQILTKNNYLDGDGVYSSLPATAKLYRVTERTEKPIYLTIPAMMLFRTKYIGYVRYFGKFGIRNSFLLKSTIFDQGNSYDGIVPTAMKNDNMSSSKRDLSIYKGSVGISGGAEWNFSGSTCLLAEIGYYYGFVNISRGNSIIGDPEKNMSVFTTFDSASHPSIYNSLSLKQNQLLLKVSILF
jgi:hypothetical protein